MRLSKEFLETKLQSLEAENALIIRLYLIEKKSQQQIAGELRFSITKAKSKISKALLELRKVSNDADYIKAMKILGK